MPRSRRRLNRPAASAEPVEPPETSACARPSATALAACTIDASGVDRTANAGSVAFAIETGASTTSTPSATEPISSAGPNSSTPIPAAAACAAPAATSAGPRSAPPASTATVTTAYPLGGLVAVARGEHLTPLVVTADRADAMWQPRAVAVRAGVVGRRWGLVLRAPLSRAGVGLLLLGDSHRRRSLVTAVRGRRCVEPERREPSP